MGGWRDPRKGFELITAALGHLRGEIHGLSWWSWLPRGAHSVLSGYTGRLPDSVEHQYTGYLAKAFKTEDLAERIRHMLGLDPRKPSQ